MKIRKWVRNWLPEKMALDRFERRYWLGGRLLTKLVKNQFWEQM